MDGHINKREIIGPLFLFHLFATFFVRLIVGALVAQKARRLGPLLRMFREQLTYLATRRPEAVCRGQETFALKTIFKTHFNKFLYCVKMFQEHNIH